MNWYEGSIINAIQAAKYARGYFVVFIYDETDSSKTSIDVLNRESITTLLGAEDVAAIKLQQGTVGAEQFAAIFPVSSVPAIYFIDGFSGILKETIVGPFEEEDLRDKIAHVKLRPLQDSDANINEAADAASNGESADTIRNISPEEIRSDESKSEGDAVTSEVPVDQVATAQTDEEAKLAIDAKIERAKALAAELQMAKEMELKEDERKKEVERRKIGQEMARAAKEKEELQKGTYAMQRKKEKAEDKLARERVKAQIAADRSERLARQALLRGENPPVSDSPAQPTAVIQEPKNAESRECSTTRIKFRLPNGSTIQAEFDSGVKLSALEDHLCRHGITPPVIMCSLLHPKSYTADEMGKSLAELCLVPSAIIIVKNKSPTSPGTVSSVNSVVASTGDGLYSFLLFLITPFNMMYNYVMQLFGLRPSVTDAPKGGNDNKQDKRDTRSHKDKKKFRKDGNVHRLGSISDDDDDDDDNNTWNGNSTQQM